MGFGAMRSKDKMQKITVEVPEALLAAAMKYTGKGKTGAVQEGLRQLAQIQAQREFLKLRGTYKPNPKYPTLEEMRSWEDENFDKYNQ